MSNSDTAQFDLSQFGSWYLLAGIEVLSGERVGRGDLSARPCCWSWTVWRLGSRQHGGYYSYEHVPAAVC